MAIMASNGAVDAPDGWLMEGVGDVRVVDRSVVEDDRRSVAALTRPAPDEDDWIWEEAYMLLEIFSAIEWRGKTEMAPAHFCRYLEPT